VRLKSVPITPWLDARFKRWLSANPANEIDYERQELAWEIAGELAKDPDIAALVAEAERSPTASRPRPVRQHLLTWCAAAAALGAVAVGIYVQWPADGELYATAVGEQRSIVLPDQSRIMLNTSTRARVSFSRTLRVIELESGEATFSVVHDPSRPFEVRAAHGTARALGTEFNVFSSSGGVTVAVLTGSVEVLAPATAGGPMASHATVLMGGQEVTYAGASVSPVRAADAERINAWHSGRIAFENVALQQALDEFNRYSVTPLVFHDPSLAELRISGVFRIDETEAFLRALDTAFGIHAQRGTDAIELRSEAQPQG
jgi:transmembrane sensor